MEIDVLVPDAWLQPTSAERLKTAIAQSARMTFESDTGTSFDVCVRNAPSRADNNEIVVTVWSAALARNGGRALQKFRKTIAAIFAQEAKTAFQPDIDIRVFSPERRTRDENIGSGVSGVPRESIGETGDAVSEEFDYEKKSRHYVPTTPQYTFERVILSDDLRTKLQESVGVLQCENKVFREWGLIEIQPHPSSALGFFGPPGTGKTMAAEAIAHKLGKKILKVSYADVESKYHGEGPKMVKSIFMAAEREDAILFFDEADSLLSKRLTNVTQGSEQAINSMRSQLLICLEDFHGIVIFATNLVANYDKAFLTRIVSVEFSIPDESARRRIWEVHLRAPDDGKEHLLNIPLADDVDLGALAHDYEFVGREIRNAVVSACVAVALSERASVGQKDLQRACDSIEREKAALAAQNGADVPDVLQAALAVKVRGKGACSPDREKESEGANAAVESAT